MKILLTDTVGFIGFHLPKVVNSGCEANHKFYKADLADKDVIEEIATVLGIKLK